jgi:hypothetical protein
MSAITANAGPLPQAGFRPPNIALTTLGLALASFMQVLDLTIANVSLRPSPATSAAARTRRRGSSRPSPSAMRSRCR